jgi:glucose/arabinose dehydrogenase
MLSLHSPNMKINILISILIVLTVVVAIGGYIMYKNAFAPTVTNFEEIILDDVSSIEVVAESLMVPWDIVQLPDKSLLVTERTGNIVRVGNGPLQRTPVPNVSPAGEGGLMGIALHPNFVSNRYLYLYRTLATDSERKNQIVRFTYNDDHTLQDERVILDNIPGAIYHDGGALAFGPDGYLYVTTGDALQPQLAQNKDSLAGKILRMNDDGTPVADNPFSSLVYSYGHRNAQGLVWDSDGQLWSTEHGRSGLQSGLDELNRIIKGGNYGWPDSQGDLVAEGTVPPVAHSGPDETWAPAGIASYENYLVFASLRGQRLYKATLTSSNRVGKIHYYFPQEYGRLRAVRIFDSTLYFTTSNTDGRGETRLNDDILVAVPLSVLIPEDRSFDTR